MSDNFAIRLSGVGKMYKLFPTRLDNMLDALDLVRFIPSRRHNYRDFWALRDIDLELPKGARIGIIGRNGAGKSTLLKLITGNLPPTEGAVEVNGNIQALLTSGAGFNPEFTGYENVRAALTYQGLDSHKIEAAIRDIAEFTELGNFLEQPFKNYSGGMQARLTFAVATTLKPDILIVDEVLGAGDAYFAAKSAERMKTLVEESGASVLIVSHALTEIMRYCDESIWIERGRVLMRGSSKDVVTRYEGFIHDMEDRRLKARNYKRFAPDQDTTHSDLNIYGDNLVLTFQYQGEPRSSSAVAEIALLRSGEIEDVLKVGDVQDSSWAQSCLVPLESGQWSEPQKIDGKYCRSLKADHKNLSGVVGNAIFYLWTIYTQSDYALKINYRSSEDGKLMLTISHNSQILGEPTLLPASNNLWAEWVFPLDKDYFTHKPKQTTTDHKDKAFSIADDQEDASPMEKGSFREDQEGQEDQSSPPIIRWASVLEDILRITRVSVIGENGQDQTVFKVGGTMKVLMTITAYEANFYRLVVGVTLFRRDGVKVSNIISEPFPIRLSIGESRVIALTLQPLNLCIANYHFSLSIFEERVHGTTRYDLHARAYEFAVVGDAEVEQGYIFKHPAKWDIIS